MDRSYLLSPLRGLKCVIGVVCGLAPAAICGRRFATEFGTFERERPVPKTAHWFALLTLVLSLFASNAHAEDEIFRPQAGEFPPLDKAHSYRGELVFVVGDDGRVDSEGERFRITAVMSSEFGGPAPASFELWECASAEGVVQVCFGAHVQEFLGLPFEERELLELSGVSTPSSPSAASGSV